MIDPWTIIGTTSAVLSFAQFAVSIVKTAVDINKSEDGASEDNKRLSEVAKNGQELLDQMSEFKASQAGRPTLTPGEESMLATAEQCRLLGEKILKFLGKMQATNEGSFRSSLKAAAKEVWYKSTVKELNEQLHSCRTQLNTHLLVVVRSQIGKDFEQLLIMHTAQAGDIARLHGLVEGLSRNQELGLAQIGQIAQIFALPTTILEEINRNKVLRGLEFDEIEVRHEQISQAPRKTFDWCVENEGVPKGHGNLKISLKQWLRAGHGIFHISAKPGGGKSTLMKMLGDDSSTQSLLKIWAADKMLVKANFFAWRAGVPSQKSMQGMLRTLLRQVLQQAPDLIQTLFPKYWKPHDFSPWMLSDGFKINLDDINDAVQLLMTNTVIAESYRFCFFLDGLDEFEDQALKHTEVAEYLRRWVSHNANGVKFCVSSREEPAFMTAFTSEQRLRLHLLTRPDIRAMVDERLMKHRQFREYEPADREQFAETVVSRAEGVFLWVHLLIKNVLWDELDEGATVDKLFSLLHKVPEELDQFFAIIFNSIRKSNKQEAAMIFAVAIQTDGWRFPLHAFHYSFLEDFIENPDFSFTIQWGFLATSDSEGTSAGGHAQKIVKRLARFNRRLPGLCKGLLERAGGRNELLFIHRSVYDFLRTGPPESMKAILDDASARTSFIIQCLTAETKCLDWLWYSLGRRSTVLGHVMDTLSSSPLAIQPFFAHLKHLDEALALRQSRKPLANPKSMFDANFRRLAISGDSRGYLSVYTFARLWQLSTYVQWARQTYPSWIFEDQVGSEVFYAAMRCRDSRRYASITLMLDNFLDPNGNSPIGNEMATCSPWMVFVGEAFSNELITRETSGFWRTFIAFLANGADPLVHFRRQPHHSCVGELQMRSGTGTDVRECSFALPQNHGSFLHSFGAYGRGRADLVDFVRHFAPPNMDEIIGLVQACMEEALGKTRWLSPLAWLPKRILDWSKPM